MKKQCIDCAHRATDCAQGLMTLPLKELLAWCKDAKKKAGVTNIKLSEITTIPIGTIERIMAGKIEDAKFSTIQPIVAALVELMPEVACPDDADQSQLKQRIAELERAAEERDKLEETLAEMRVSHAAEMETMRKDSEKRVDYLKGEVAAKETRSTRLLRGLIALGLFDILILTLDMLIPTIGFFRY